FSRRTAVEWARTMGKLGDCYSIHHGGLLLCVDRASRFSNRRPLCRGHRWRDLGVLRGLLLPVHRVFARDTRAVHIFTFSKLLRCTFNDWQNEMGILGGGTLWNWDIKST